MFKIKIQGNEKLLAYSNKIGAFKYELLNEIEQQVLDFANAVVSRAKEHYLSGPRPEKLAPVTGRLRASIGMTVLRGNQSIKVFFGTDVPYARVHEEGFRGTVSISSFARKTKFGTTTVRAHSRNVNIKERPFLKPAVQDEYEGLRTKLIQTLKAALT